MNLLNEYNLNQIKLLTEAGLNIEDREYSNEEIKKFSTGVINYIMSYSKNDIRNIHKKYADILEKLN